MMGKARDAQLPSYTQFACIGSGLSAIALGAQLQRWYGLKDIAFFERAEGIGGTWWANSYPGAACDIPSVLYSFSFEPNPDWTKLMSDYREIRAYASKVAEKYDLASRMQFCVSVEKCVWRDDANRWLLHVRNLKTDQVFLHECQVLISAAGILVHPREIDVPGAETFAGKIFHSARWDHSVDLTGKDVVVIGNGCTANQIVPALADSVNSLTQCIRTKHWIFPKINVTYPPSVRWMFKYVPGLLWLHRLQIALLVENSFRMFYMTRTGAKMREQKAKECLRYIKKEAPEKYHELLIPDFEVGCKRRIFDDGYLESLNNPKVTLTDEKVLEIVPQGLRTADGTIKADVIVLANGFETNEFFPHTEIVGKDGVSLKEHWNSFGGPTAYNCSVVNGFPNFFMLLGPNSATGHTSALLAAENTVNYALRILKPLVQGDVESVELKKNAEEHWAHAVQAQMKKLVFATGCDSWYVRKDGWNSMTYPWWQGDLWFRCLFPRWRDWTVKPSSRPKRSWKGVLPLPLLLASLFGALAYDVRTGGKVSAMLLERLRGYLKIR